MAKRAAKKVIQCLGGMNIFVFPDVMTMGSANTLSRMFPCVFPVSESENSILSSKSEKPEKLA